MIVPDAVPDTVVVALHADTVLEVSIRRDLVETTLSLPLDITNIRLAADAIATAVGDVIDRKPDSEADERFELLLRARRKAHLGFEGVQPALDMLETAHSRWPDDPRIACEIASLLVRFGFIRDDLERAHARAQALVATALAGAPELAESHVAAGQLELNAGNPILAAREFRTALAYAPHLAEPHEGLGRMLLEAGFLDDAAARLDTALAIAPKLSSVRWEIARAHASRETGCSTIR